MADRRLVPDYKTIADFRKDNGRAIHEVCARCVGLCREMGLLTTASVAIDGSKFKAVNNRDRNFTRAKITGLREKIAKLGDEMRRLAEIEARMLESPDRQVALTDPDARSMATSGRGSGVVGCNVQVAVDTEDHLIVAHEATNVGSDLAGFVVDRSNSIDDREFALQRDAADRPLPERTTLDKDVVDLGGAEPIGGQEHDFSPPDVLLRIVPIGDDSSQTRTIRHCHEQAKPPSHPMSITQVRREGTLLSWTNH